MGCEHSTLVKIRITDVHWAGGVWDIYRCESCGETFQEPETFEITREVKTERL